MHLYQLKMVSQHKVMIFFAKLKPVFKFLYRKRKRGRTFFAVQSTVWGQGWAALLAVRSCALGIPALGPRESSNTQSKAIRCPILLQNATLGFSIHQARANRAFVTAHTNYPKTPFETESTKIHGGNQLILGGVSSTQPSPEHSPRCPFSTCNATEVEHLLGHRASSGQFTLTEVKNQTGAEKKKEREELY